MVVPNRVLGNIQFSPSAFIPTAPQMECLPAGSAMDIDITKKVDNFDSARGRSPSPSNVSSRSASVKLKASSIPYHERMVIQNNLPDEELREPINCSQLSYDNNCQETSHVNMAVDPVVPQGSQHVSNKALVLNISSFPCVDDDDVINIQLLYDLN